MLFCSLFNLTDFYCSPFLRLNICFKTNLALCEYTTMPFNVVDFQDKWKAPFKSQLLRLDGKWETIQIIYRTPLNPRNKKKRQLGILTYQHVTPAKCHKDSYMAIDNRVPCEYSNCYSFEARENTHHLSVEHDWLVFAFPTHTINSGKVQGFCVPGRFPGSRFFRREW